MSNSEDESNTSTDVVSTDIHEDGSVTVFLQDDGGVGVARNDWIMPIYISHILSTWGDRSWEFLVPLAFAEIFPFTLLPVSLILFVENIMGAVFGSFMGTMVDRTSRNFIVKFTLIIQNIMIVISTFLFCGLWWMYYGQNDFCAENATSDCVSLWKDPSFIIIFSILCLTNSVSMLFSMASSIAVERDWVVVLSDSDSVLLTRTNSVMQRIDLVCKVGAPAVLGFILQVTPLIYVLIGIALWNIFTFFPELGILLKVYGNYEGILKKTDANETEADELADDTQQDGTNNNVTEKEKTTICYQIADVIRTTMQGWKVYFTHRVMLASLSFVLLFCTVLAPGGLFNAYLKIEGIEDWMLGVMTAVAAIIGLIATFIQPILAIRFGERVTGIAMLWLQTIILFLAVLCLFLEFTYSLFLLMALVAIARFPLWSFDLVERQIMQLGIGEKERGIVNSVETSMTNIATLVIYLLGVLFADPEQFIYLASFSLFSVSVASILFSIWSLYVKRNSSSTSEKSIELENLAMEGKGD